MAEHRVPSNLDPQDMPLTPKQREALMYMEGLEKARDLFLECIDGLLREYSDALKGETVNFIEEHPLTPEDPPKRHTMTEEGRKAVAQAQRERWKQYRRERNRKIIDSAKGKDEPE